MNGKLQLSGEGVLGIGVDLVAIDRFSDNSERLAKRLLTPAEREECRNSLRFAEWLAGRFAAKEAVLKALGTGLAAGLSWQQIEVRVDSAGKPGVTLSGAAAERMEQLGGTRVLLSIAHDGGTAIAFAQLIR